jgi:hypothetical protein
MHYVRPATSRDRVQRLAAFISSVRSTNTGAIQTTYHPPCVRSSIPSSARARYTLQSSRNASSPACCASSNRAAHCVSAWNAIHTFFRANARSGTLAGFCAGQSKGCVFSERLRHRRWQNRAGHGADDVDAEQRRTSEESESGVVQCPHARDATCRSYMSLRRGRKKH